MEDIDGIGRISSIADLGPGDHLCCLYRTEDEHRNLIGPFLKHGLERGEKVIYIVDSHTAEEVIGYMEGEGVKVQPYLDSGQLSMLIANDAYTRGGRFDPDGMIGLLREETDRAVKEGYSALRVTGEMTWALRGLPGSERLIEYEAKLNEFFRENRCLAICQYDRRRFSPEILEGVLATHPIAVIGEEIYENFYYIPPEKFFGDNAAEVILDNRLSNLASRHASEIAFRENETKYRSIVEQSIDGIVLVDSRGTVIAWNSAQEHITGLRRGDVLGRPIWDVQLELVPRDHKDRVSLEDFKATLIEALSRGYTAWAGETSEREIQLPGGEKRFIQAAAFPIETREGLMVGSIIRDVTDRRRYEEALVESRERWQRSFDAIDDAMFVMDKDFRITLHNSALCRLLGNQDDYTGRICCEVIHGTGQPPEFCICGDAVRNNRVTYAEFYEPYLDKHLSAYLAPVLDSDGNMEFGVHVVRDVTERKMAEEALAWEAEVRGAIAELSSALLAQAPIKDLSSMVLESARRLTESRNGFVGYIDSDTGHLVSPALSGDMWGGYRVEDGDAVFSEFAGPWGWVLRNREPLLSSGPGRDPALTEAPGGQAPIEHFISVPALMGGALVGQIALANSSREYTERDLELLRRLADLYAIAVLRTWSEGELERYREHLEELVRQRTLELEDANIKLQEEITERRRNQEELQVTAERLRALSARVESVREEERHHVAREVHDTLGQSLTGLKISLSLLRKRLAGDAEAEARISSMAELVDTTVKAVREISMRLRPVMLDDLGLAAALEWQLKGFEEMTGLKCRFVSETEDEPIHKDQAITLFRIAQEALTNAARHAGASRVEVRLQSGRDGTLLEIADDGRGISEREIEGKRSLGILGMRERANIYGGEVEIKSGNGGGTTVVVRMPPPDDIPGGERERGGGGS